MHWLAYWLGLTNASGHPYLWWSGIAGDLGFLGGATVLYRKHACHQRGCWRLGKHPHGPYVLCAKHHPSVPDRGREGVRDDATDL